MSSLHMTATQEKKSFVGIRGKQGNHQRSFFGCDSTPAPRGGQEWSLNNRDCAVNSLELWPGVFDWGDFLASATQVQICLVRTQRARGGNATTCMSSQEAQQHNADHQSKFALDKTFIKEKANRSFFNWKRKFTKSWAIVQIMFSSRTFSPCSGRAPDTFWKQQTTEAGSK